MFSHWKKRRTADGHTIRRGFGTKLAVALLIGAAIGYAPITGFGQGKPPAKEIPQVPPVCKGALGGGDNIKLMRTVRKNNPEYPIATYGNGQTLVNDADPPGVDFVIDDSGPDNIVVTATVPKSYLSSQGSPLEVISASVVVRAGSASCYWDCYYVNGKKICECIEG